MIRIRFKKCNKNLSVWSFEILFEKRTNASSSASDTFDCGSVWNKNIVCPKPKIYLSFTAVA